VTTTAQLLLEWDKRRPRSQQTELGMSELGGCRRRAGYRLAGQAPTNEGGSVQAVMGTAIHAAVEQVFHDMQAAGLIPAEDLVEHEVSFAGVLGHFDRYEAATETLYDTKTTNENWLKHIVLHGADQQHTWQGHLYAAALMRTGRKVCRIVIDYIARDTGNDHQVTMPFEVRHVRDALAWLENVRSVEVDVLNRDYAPDTAFCGHCPFMATCWGNAVPDRSPLSVLYVEDPDARKWAEQLHGARAVIAEAKKLEAEAKGALDALRPNVIGKSDPVDIGWDWDLQWTVSNTTRIDTDQVRAEYAKAGAKPPTNTSTSTKLGFIPKPDPREEP
jgi:hypothetical protein